MRIPKYWAKESYEITTSDGATFEAACWRWSFESGEDAAARAREAARKAAQRFEADGEPDRYAYADRPLREEVLHEITDDGSRPVAVITRNSYGALVLNTDRIMFIDIDLEPDGGFTNLFRGLGFKVKSQRDKALDTIRDWPRRHTNTGLRVYDTFKGLRVLVTTGFYDPKAPATKEILSSFGSDELYVRLCAVQECFRARISPKHWRCGLEKPPASYPFANADAARRMEEWVKEYETKTGSFATCRLSETVGAGAADPLITKVIELHDHYCSVGTDRKLA